MRPLTRRAFLSSTTAATLGGMLTSSFRDVGAARAEEIPSSTALFSDVAQQVGLDFIHFNGMSGEHYYPEIMASGAALFDYDNDGDLDIFLVQGQMLGPGRTLQQAVFPPKAPLPLKGRLYRNDSVLRPDGTRVLRFTDVTEQAGIDARGYGMGVATGDYNNDGWMDLYICNLGRNQLWRNNRDGTFTDVSRMSGTDDPSWTVCAAFVDYDRDGWLDLFVGNYVDFSFSNLKTCYSYIGQDYCGPLGYQPVPNRLFRNRRDGTFEDVTAQSKIGSEYNGAMGVVCADFNGDGWTDIFVSNDKRPNLLWLNQKDGTFKNGAMLAGCALNRNGGLMSGMGVDAGDFDNDGDEDLVVTTLADEYVLLYMNDGKGLFEDRSYESGIAPATTAYTGFGVGFIDYDNDGWQDIFMATGEVRAIEAQARAGDPYPLKQKKLLFRNLRNGSFEDVSPKAGDAFQLVDVGRAVAFGDVNNDGYMDVLVANNCGPVQLLVNTAGRQNHWLGLRMIGKDVNRDVLGTRIAVFRRQGPPLWRRVHSDGSYSSANDPRVLVGLGESPEISKVRAYWVSGRVEEWTGLRVNTYTTLREASGKLVTTLR